MNRGWSAKRDACDCFSDENFFSLFKQIPSFPNGLQNKGPLLMTHLMWTTSEKRGANKCVFKEIRKISDFLCICSKKKTDLISLTIKIDEELKNIISAMN